MTDDPTYPFGTRIKVVGRIIPKIVLAQWRDQLWVCEDLEDQANWTGVVTTHDVEKVLTDDR